MQPIEPVVVRQARLGVQPLKHRDAQAASSDHAEKSPAGSPDGSPGLAAALPTTCPNAKRCAPPPEFAKAACRGHYPSMAIAMFEKHTPWQRLYVKVATVEAVNAYGDRTITAPLVFGEEVLVLRGVSQSKSDKLQVSSSDIDVLRWDGTCATVHREQFSTAPIANMTQAAIRWRHIEDPIQQALLSSKYVARAHENHRSACKGARSGAEDPKCQKATEKLSEAIGVAVRGGLAVPTPVNLPVWATPEQVGSQATVAMTGAEP